MTVSDRVREILDAQTPEQRVVSANYLRALGEHSPAKSVFTETLAEMAEYEAERYNELP